MFTTLVYYSSLKRFITFFYETQNNDIPQERARKCKLVLEYCKNNHKVIGRGEDLNRTEEAVIEFHAPNGGKATLERVRLSRN